MWHALKHGCLCCFICKRNLWVPKELMGALANFSKILYHLPPIWLIVALWQPISQVHYHPQKATHFTFDSLSFFLHINQITFNFLNPNLIFGFMEILFRATPTILLYYCSFYHSQNKLISRTNLAWKGGKLILLRTTSTGVIPITAPGWENWWQQLTWQLHPALTSRSFF